MKPSRNRYLSKIGALVGENDPKRAVQVFVNEQRGSIVSLDDLARKFGVEKILEERLPFEGGLFRATDGGLVIKLNACSPSTRKRFTLAHELAHLLLGTIPGHRNAGHSDVNLERACDMVAAELLMPSDEAVPFIRKLGAPSPEKLRVIASEYVVSLWAAAIRVHSDLGLWKCCIGFWEKQQLVRTVWFVGQKRWNTAVPDSYSLDLAADSDKSVQTTELWEREGFSEPVGLSLLRLGFDKVHENQRFLGLVSFLN